MEKPASHSRNPSRQIGADYQTLIPGALNGDLEALEEILRSIKDQIFNLSLHFLWHPEDAEDASQEILVKIMLNLNQFQFRSAFTTWTYRIAMNYLIDARKSRLERAGANFLDSAKHLQSMPDPRSLPAHRSEEDGSWEATVREVKTACSHAMLQCLDRDGRAAFILGEVFGMHSEDAAYVLSVTPQAYRKRLSRARTAMDEFLERSCGLKNPTNPCRCTTRACQIQDSSVLKKYLAYSSRIEKAPDQESTQQPVSPQENDSLDRLAWIYRTNPRYALRTALLERIRRNVTGVIEHPEGT